MKEEFLVDVDVLNYLGSDETDESIANFFLCKIINGIPKLSGEELERCSENNYYEIRKVKLSDLDKINVLGKKYDFKGME